jgi:hypothetical protein
MKRPWLIFAVFTMASFVSARPSESAETKAKPKSHKFEAVQNNGKTFEPTKTMACSCAYYGGCGSCAENSARVVCYCDNDPEPWEFCAACSDAQKHNIAARGAVKAMTLKPEAAMKPSDCGTYPNCNSDACISKKLCTCVKNDAGKVCGASSCIDSSDCK